jgi:hypothetical protein
MQKQVRMLSLFIICNFFILKVVCANKDIEVQKNNFTKLFPHAIISADTYGILNQQEKL